LAQAQRECDRSDDGVEPVVQPLLDRPCLPGFANLALVDLPLILTSDPAVIKARLRARGGHSRFERAADDSERESALYARAVADLLEAGWPVQTLDCTAEGSDVIAARIVALIYRVVGEKSLVCP